MEILNALLTEFLDFFRLGGLYNILKSGNYSSLKTVSGLIALLTPLAPLVIFGEMGLLLFVSRKSIKGYKINLLVIFVNRVLGHLVSFSVILFCYGAVSSYAFFTVSWSGLWCVYAFVSYELGTYIYHYSAHKVRILWCFHAVHHSPETLNASVTLRTFYLENLYTELIRTSIVALAGVPLAMYFFVMTIDSIWGAFVHISENVLRNGRLGLAEKFVLTPSHHRVHHGRNLLYLDRNFCGMVNVWDRLFGTYQEERIDTPVEFGLNRLINADNFWAVYFGEFPLLWTDIRSAKGLTNKIKYVFMPPGWRPDTPCFTVKQLKKSVVAGVPQEEVGR